MNDIIRETFHSVEYDEYYASLDEKTKTKYDYVEYSRSWSASGCCF
jgi:hypothetical protein